MIILLVILVGALIVSYLPMSDVSTKRPVNVLFPKIRKWWNSYPKYRIVQTRNSVATENWYRKTHTYTVQERRAFSPFWCQENWSYDKADALKYIQTQREEQLRSQERAVITPIE